MSDREPRDRRRWNAWQRLQRRGLVHGEQPFPARMKPPRHIPRFHLPAGTACDIRRMTESEWRPFTTTRDLSFERYERYVRDEAGNFYEFRIGLWLITVHRRDVVHRDDILSRDAPRMPAAS